MILAAHSAGCLMVAHWAQQYARPIAGALLVTPADIETPMPEPYPTIDALRANGWLPTPRNRLPFRSILAASTDDPLATVDRSGELARDWGSALFNLGPVGHLNPAAGFGPWPRAIAFLEALEQSAHADAEAAG